MALIFLAITALLLMVNLAGVGILLNRWIGHYPLAKAVGVLAFCLVLFFVEHFIGLGKLPWLWPISTAASLCLLYRYQHKFLKSLWRAESIFALGLAYGLIWRIAFPDIDGGSEDLSDLSFISNYFAGDTLPPQDNWLPGYPFNFYYAFQHYGAALLGRILGLDLGYSYNLSIALLCAFMVSLSWSIASLFCRGVLLKLVLVMAVVCGGTGVSPFVPFMYQSAADNPSAEAFTSSNRLWASIRFIGKYDGRVNTEFGKNLVGDANDNPELPLETIGYLTYQGDYHAPLGGFLLLMLAMLCILLLEGKNLYRLGAAPHTEKILQALLVSTGPLMLITNTWVLPMQTLLVAAWLAYRLIKRQPPCWLAVVLGGLIPLLLILPFLKEFAASAQSTPIGWVKAQEHTPLNLGVLVLWPQLLLIGLGLFVTRKQPVAWLLLGAGIFLLIFTEFVYVDDPVGDKYNRFNSTLKWWSWLQVAILLGLGSVLLGANNLLVKSLSLVAVLSVASYSLEMANNWVRTSKPSFAKLQGNHWLRKDSVNNGILTYLRDAPQGIVLEGIDRASYSATSAFALFANKRSFTGWPSREALWRSNADFIRVRGDEAMRFYRGELNHSLAWLTKHNIRYIIWTHTDRKRSEHGWSKIQQQIGEHYIWIPVQEYGSVRLGIWQEKNKERF